MIFPAIFGLMVSAAIAFPAMAQVNEAARSFAINIDPPDTALIDDDKVCRSGKITAGSESAALTLCLAAVVEKSLNLTIAAPTAGLLNEFSLLDRPEVAVALLADRRYEDFWPLLLRFGGENGDKLVEVALRTRLTRVNETPRKARAGDALASSLDEKSRQAVAEAKILSTWGLTEAALARLDAVLPVPDAKGKIAGNDNFLWVGIQLQRANALRAAGRIDDVLATYSAVEANKLIDAEYRANATVNKAALLAELARPVEALAAIDKVSKMVEAAAAENEIEGSRRQVLWIRSCALDKLGRTQEAQTLVQGIFGAQPSVPNSLFAANGPSLEVRYRWCVLDRAWIARSISDDLKSSLPAPGSVQLVYGGLDFPRYRAFVDAGRAELIPAEAVAHLREPPPGWIDLLDKRTRKKRAEPILALIEK